MKKHIAPPATAEEIRQTLGVTKEDMEIVKRVLRDLGYYEDEEAVRPPSSSSDPETPHYRLLKKDQ